MGPVLVTGASGYTGKHLARRLVSMGIETHAVLRPTSIDPSIEGLHCHRCQPHTSDLLEALRQSQARTVFHLAAAVITRPTKEQEIEMTMSNVVFSHDLLDAMARAGTQFFVNTGTTLQHPWPGSCLYAKQKNVFEASLYTAPFNHITIKPHGIYGPDDDRPRLLNFFKRAIHEPLKMSHGRQEIDMLHVDDVVDAFLHAAGLLLTNKVASGSDFSVTSDKRITVRELAALYERIVGAKLQLEWDAMPYDGPMTVWRERPLPGWTPKIGLERGLQDAISSESIGQ